MCDLNKVLDCSKRDAEWMMYLEVIRGGNN